MEISFSIGSVDGYEDWSGLGLLAQKIEISEPKLFLLEVISSSCGNGARLISILGVGLATQRYVLVPITKGLKLMFSFGRQPKMFVFG